MKRRITFLVTIFLITTASLLNAAGVVLTKKTPSQAEEYWSPVEFGSIENFPTSVVITSKETKQTTTIPRHQIGVVIEFLDFNSISILNEDGINKVKAERDAVARHAGQCKSAAAILSVVVRNYDQVLGYYAEGNVLIAGKWLKKHDYEAKQKADALAATAGAIPEVVAGTKTFKNVRVTKVVDDRISIMHEGGIASLNTGDLSEEMRMRIEIAFPKYFQKTIQTTTAEEEPTISGTASSQGNSEKSMVQNSAGVKGLNLDPPVDKNLRASEITFDAAQLALLKDKDLGRQLAAQLVECEAMLDKLNGRKKTIGMINPLKLEFRVLKKLEHKDFSIVTTPGNGLFEITCGLSQKNSILVTISTNYTSEGLASLWVVEKGEVKVKLDSGFESTALVYEELSPDAVKYLEDVSLVHRLIANAKQLYVDAIHRQDAIEYASRIFPALVESPQVKLSRKLQTRGFQAEVIGKNMGELRACLVAKDWDRFYQLALEKKTDAKLKNAADVQRVIDAAQRFEWKIVLQAKGFVFADQHNVLERGKDGQREKYIAMVVVPPSGSDWIQKRSRGFELKTPKIVICNNQNAVLHPDHNGIIYRVAPLYGDKRVMAEHAFCFFEIFGNDNPDYIQDQEKNVDKAVRDATTLYEIEKSTAEEYEAVINRIASKHWNFIMGDILHNF